jgi:hypothetical protein
MTQPGSRSISEQRPNGQRPLQGRNVACRRRAADKKRQLHRRVPTSLLVTLLGIALTAWLLPAVTHQWDDRQKAHDVKAAMVADQVSMTARALVVGEQSSPKRAQQISQQRRDAWLLASAEIEARLHAYFPARLVAAWQLYAYFVDRAVGVADALADATLERALNWLYHDLIDARPSRALDAQIGGAAKVALAYLKMHERKTERPRFSTQRQWLEQALPPYTKLPPATKKTLDELKARQDDTGLRVQLLDFQQTLAASALTSHLTGFSTNANDFLNDLIP